MTFKWRIVLTEALPDGTSKDRDGSKGKGDFRAIYRLEDWGHISAENICLFSWGVKDELECSVDSRATENHSEEARLNPNQRTGDNGLVRFQSGYGPWTGVASRAPPFWIELSVTVVLWLSPAEWWWITLLFSSQIFRVRATLKELKLSRWPQGVLSILRPNLDAGFLGIQEMCLLQILSCLERTCVNTLGSISRWATRWWPAQTACHLRSHLGYPVQLNLQRIKALANIWFQLQERTKANNALLGEPGQTIKPWEKNDKVLF